MFHPKLTSNTPNFYSGLFWVAFLRQGLISFSLSDWCFVDFAQ
jgi:hypothetical protein